MAPTQSIREKFIWKCFPEGKRRQMLDAVPVCPYGRWHKLYPNQGCRVPANIALVSVICFGGPCGTRALADSMQLSAEKRTEILEKCRRRFDSNTRSRRGRSTTSIAATNTSAVSGPQQKKRRVSSNVEDDNFDVTTPSPPPSSPPPSSSVPSSDSELISPTSSQLDTNPRARHMQLESDYRMALAVQRTFNLEALENLGDRHGMPATRIYEGFGDENTHEYSLSRPAVEELEARVMAGIGRRDNSTRAGMANQRVRGVITGPGSSDTSLTSNSAGPSNVTAGRKLEVSVHKGRARTKGAVSRGEEYSTSYFKVIDANHFEEVEGSELGSDDEAFVFKSCD